MWIKHKDKVLGINLDLIREQKIDFDTLCEIVKLHKIRSDLFDILTSIIDPTIESALIRILFKQLREIEFELQILWGFPTNEIMHRSYLLPHCTCPKLDNRDAFPHIQYKDGGCPLHGPDLISNDI
jgi:hypothetical protein